MMQILGLLAMYLVFVKTSSLLFRLALGILCKYARKSTLEITSSTLQRRRKVDILEEQKWYFITNFVLTY